MKKILKIISLIFITTNSQSVISCSKKEEPVYRKVEIIDLKNQNMEWKFKKNEIKNIEETKINNLENSNINDFRMKVNFNKNIQEPFINKLNYKSNINSITFSIDIDYYDKIKNKDISWKVKVKNWFLDSVSFYKDFFSFKDSEVEQTVNIKEGINDKFGFCIEYDESVIEH